MSISFPLWPLGRFLRSIPDPVHVQVVGRLANHLLRGQLSIRQLAPLEGKCMCLAITDTGNTWRFRVQDGRLRPASASVAWDVRIQGSLADLLLLATRSEDADTLFFARRLSLEGDTEIGLYVKNLLDALEFDWEVHVAGVTGARTATRLSSGLRRTGLDRPLRVTERGLRDSLAALARAGARTGR